MASDDAVRFWQSEAEVPSELVCAYLEAGRRVEVLQLVARGLSNKQVARAIGRTDETVKVHLKNIFAKLDVADRTEAVTMALSRGLIHLE